MTNYKYNDMHDRDDPVGNIRVLRENRSEDGRLEYLGYNLDTAQWGWANTVEGAKESHGFSDFHEARSVSDTRYMLVVETFPNDLATQQTPDEVPARTVRSEVLDEAKRITATDRNSQYGEPEDNFQRIADYWNVWLQDRLKDGAEITAGDTAAMQIMVKLAREMNAPKLDNKVDGAGYFACWAEVDSKKEKF